MRRLLVAGAALALLLTFLAPASVRRPASGASAKKALSPVAVSDAEYSAFGRVFPDPHGCRDGAPGSSPFAKGKVCAADFIQIEEFTRGSRYMEKLFPDFIRFYKLSDDFNCRGKPVGNPRKGCKAFKSAGLPVTVDENGRGFVREKRNLFMVRITDETVPNKNKKYFVFPLSIHGIERAGVEGGTRAAEDLATWGACEAGVAPAIVDCASADNSAPHPLLEATPNKSITAGEALRKSAVFFIYPNMDGWLRGDRFRNGIPSNSRFYQRYNGNGVDLNRDWPEQGYTFRPYTPWSEPETKSFGRVLQAIGPKTSSGRPNWTGGIDLHGQLIDRAFSFTLIGGSQRNYGENQRILQTVKGAWADAEQRLAWSPIIKPNDAPDEDPRVYGVQWGTIWDTIDYTVTGALGDWIDSPIGLNADGIDNEMSMSHLINCGVGTCYIPDGEQLHVDGNKSLVYSMINYSLKRESKTFGTDGRVGYLFNRRVVSSPTRRLSRPPRFATLPPQKDIRNELLTPANEFTHEFRVKGPSQGVYNGGIAAQLTCASEVNPCAFSEARLERKNPREKDPQADDDWEIVNTYYNQSPIYAQGGMALHANLPTPGRYRVRIVDGEAGTAYDLDVNFTREKGWPDPGQIGYRASNMRFWSHLQRYARPGLDRLTAGQIENTSSWRSRYDTIVATNTMYRGLAGELKRWVIRNDGNLVLTDKAIKMLPRMGVVDGGVKKKDYYAGYLNFATQGDDETYDDPLARNIDQPGAAEGQTCGPTDPDPCTPEDEVHRRQTYEPVPLGFAIQKPDGDDAFNAPVWFVRAGAWNDAAGNQRAVATTGRTSNVSYGEIKLGGGRIRIIGAVLPMPSERFDHPFGLASHALTYSGYQVLKNALTWER